MAKMKFVPKVSDEKGNVISRPISVKENKFIAKVKKYKKLLKISVGINILLLIGLGICLIKSL
jgi:hypothetical protein